MNALAQKIVDRLSARLVEQVSKYAKNRVASGQLGFGFKADDGHAGQKSFKWKEELHPRDAEGKFATEEEKGVNVEEPGKIPRKFMTAGEAAMAGKSHNQWTGAIQDAFVNEEINDDHPAWQSILHGNAPTIHQYHDAQSIFGQHVRSMNGNTMGRVTGLSDDARTATVTGLDGNKSVHGPETLHHLGADVTRRLQSAGHLSVKEHAKYLGRVLAQEAIENDENIGVTMKRHGISPTATEIRSSIAENVEKLKAKPSTARTAQVAVAGMQQGLFNGGERAGGQKSLFNVVKPSSKDKPTGSSEPKLTGRMAEFLGKKDTISPADLAVPLAPKSLPGQKAFFSAGRSGNQITEALRMALFGAVEKYRQSHDPNEEGHWVTINGNHVFIKDANAGDHAKSMGQLHRVRAEHVQHLMPEAHKFLKDQIDQREVAKAHARKLSRLNAGSIGKIENSYRDWSSVDGFDTMARDVAIAHPELGLDPNDTDTPGKVWELIREGKEAYPAADSKEVAELAAKWLKSSTPKAKEVHPEDALEFSRKGEVYRPGVTFAERVAYALRQRVEKYSFNEQDHPRDESGQFTEKGGDTGRVKMRQAKAGGEVSEVDGKFYKGGHWLPVHGKYSGQEKPAKKPQQEGDSGPVFASENSKGPVMARQLSPEQVEEEMARDREQRDWSRIQSGPLGQLLHLGDEPHHIRHTHGDVRKWAELFESGDITTDSLEDATDYARDQVQQIEESKSAMTAEDWEYYSGWINEHAERDRRDYSPRQIKKLLNANPAITNARSWLSTLMESRQDIDTLKELNNRLAGSVAKYSFQESQHPRKSNGEFTDKEGGSPQNFAEQASQYFADDVNGKESEGPKTYDDMLYEAQQDFDFAEQDYDYAADTFQQLDKAATSKASKAQKLRERAKAKAERAARATIAEKAARNKMDAASAIASDAYEKAQELLKIAQADDATDEQVKASDDADELVEKLNEQYDVAEAAWDTAINNEMDVHEAADEAESEADNADDEAYEARKEADEAKAEVAGLAKAMEDSRKKLAALQGGDVQRYAADKDGDRWITIGGSDDGDHKHAGGTPVKIDKTGKIVAGPESLTGKKVDDLGDKKQEAIKAAEVDASDKLAKSQPEDTNKRNVPYQNPHTKKWHILNKKTGDKSDQGFYALEECQEAINSPEFRPMKIGDRIYVVDRYGDKHWRWPDKSYDSIGQCQAEIDNKIKDDAESAKKSAESRRKTQALVPTFGPNGTHTFLDDGPAK